jgi:F0F1-type ATP synthase assembly protein I
VIDTLALSVAWLAGAVALYAAWKTVRHTRFNDPMFYAIGAVEVGTIVMLVAGIVAIATTERDVPTALLLSYLITLVLVPPVAVIWGVAEKSRWGTGVVLIGMWTVSVMAVRVIQVWHG